MRRIAERASNCVYQEFASGHHHCRLEAKTIGTSFDCRHFYFCPNGTLPYAFDLEERSSRIGARTSSDVHKATAKNDIRLPNCFRYG